MGGPDCSAVFSANVPLAFVDVETTGGQAGAHRVTEIAIVGVRGDREEFRWSTLVNPGVRIPPFIVSLTGIDNDMVADAPDFAAIAPQLAERLAGRLFVAHNVRFDYSFIRSEFRRAGQHWQARHACTVKLSRRLYPRQPRHSLDALIETHALKVPTRHRAMPDADALWQFWQKMRSLWPLAALDRALLESMQVPVLPPQLPPDLLNDLPESHGVYRFFSADGALLYVGKANNIAERIVSHFAAASRPGKSQRLAQQTVRIEWTETAGELAALLLEARLVREHQPVYNRRLRGGELWSWCLTDAASTPQLVSLDVEIATGDHFGSYLSAASARRALTSVARDNALCLKALGLEPGDGACFGYQIKLCRGACVGAEPQVMHLLRLRLALAKLKFATWPFAGPVAFLEGRHTANACWHLLDNWRHLASVPGGLAEHELPEALPVAGSRPGFDVDVYRILRRWSRSAQARTSVLLRPSAAHRCGVA